MKKKRRKYNNNNNNNNKNKNQKKNNTNKNKEKKNKKRINLLTRKILSNTQIIVEQLKIVHQILIMKSARLKYKIIIVSPKKIINQHI